MHTAARRERRERIRVQARIAAYEYAKQKGVFDMPTKVETKLRKEAQEKFPGDKERQDRYIYGTMRKQGWKPEREKK